jgi:hypothetical protein
MLFLNILQESITMAGKSSANENKVFAMSVTKPSIKLGKNGRGASFAWKSGRGGVSPPSMVINPPF